VFNSLLPYSKLHRDHQRMGTRNFCTVRVSSEGHSRNTNLERRYTVTITTIMPLNPSMGNVSPILQNSAVHSSKWLWVAPRTMIMGQWTPLALLGLGGTILGSVYVQVPSTRPVSVFSYYIRYQWRVLEWGCYWKPWPNSQSTTSCLSMTKCKLHMIVFCYLDAF
jgi:hypothetical protein